MLDNNTTKENTTPNYMTNLPALMVQAYTHLQFAEWKKASFLFDKVIAASPDAPDGYLGKLLATLKLKDEQELATCTKPYTELEIYKTLLAKAGVDLYNRLIGYAEATAEERAKNASKSVCDEESVFAKHPKLVPILHAVGALLGLLLMSLLTLASDYRYWPVLFIASVPAIDVFVYYLLTAKLYAEKKRNGAIPFFVLLADALLVFVLSCLSEIEYFDNEIFTIVFGLAFVAIVCVGYYFAFIKYLKITPTFLRALIPYSPVAGLVMAAGILGFGFYQEYEPILFHLFIIFSALALAYAPAVAAVQLIKKRKLVGILPAAASAAILLACAFLFFITPYTYEKNSDGYTVTGTRNTGLNVNIPAQHNGEPVTEIGDRAFLNRDFKKVTLPDSITRIGESAFGACWNLRRVEIPEGVVEIGKNAFASSYYLHSVTISDSVKIIGEGAFRNCDNLEVVNLGNGVEIIGEYAFEDCTRLLSSPLPDSLKSIGSFAYAKCTALSELVIPADAAIGEYAFAECRMIKSIIIEDGVTSIGKAAFTSCHGVESITIPASVTSIGQWAFYYCTSLTAINYCGTEEQWNSIAADVLDPNLPVTVTFNYVPAE